MRLLWLTLLCVPSTAGATKPCPPGPDEPTWTAVGHIVEVETVAQEVLGGPAGATAESIHFTLRVEEWEKGSGADRIRFEKQHCDSWGRPDEGARYRVRGYEAADWARELKWTLLEPPPAPAEGGDASTPSESGTSAGSRRSWDQRAGAALAVIAFLLLIGVFFWRAWFSG